MFILMIYAYMKVCVCECVNVCVCVCVSMGKHTHFLGKICAFPWKKKNMSLNGKKRVFRACVNREGILAN